MFNRLGCSVTDGLLCPCYTTVTYRLITSQMSWWRTSLAPGSRDKTGQSKHLSNDNAQYSDSRQSPVNAPRRSPRPQHPIRVLPRLGCPYVCRLSFRPRRRSWRRGADRLRNQARGGSRSIGEGVATMFQPATEGLVTNSQTRGSESTHFYFLPCIRPIAKKLPFPPSTPRFPLQPTDRLLLCQGLESAHQRLGTRNTTAPGAHNVGHVGRPKDVGQDRRAHSEREWADGEGRQWFASCRRC